MLPKSVAQSDSIMSTIVKDDVHMMSWKGNDKRILLYPVDYDKQFNVVCTYPSELSNQQTSNNDSAAVFGRYIVTLHLSDADTLAMQHTTKKYHSTPS